MIKHTYFQRNIYWIFVAPMMIFDFIYVFKVFNGQFKGIDLIMAGVFIVILGASWLVPLIYFLKGPVIKVKAGQVGYYIGYFAKVPQWQEPLENYQFIRCHIKESTGSMVGSPDRITNCKVTLWHKIADKRVAIMIQNDADYTAKRLTAQCAQAWQLDQQYQLFGQQTTVNTKSIN